MPSNKPYVKPVTETKDIGTMDKDTEGGENDAEQTVKAPDNSEQGVASVYAHNYHKEQCLAWAAQVHQGTMSAHSTVVQSAQAYYDWLTSD